MDECKPLVAGINARDGTSDMMPFPGTPGRDGDGMDDGDDDGYGQGSPGGGPGSIPAIAAAAAAVGRCRLSVSNHCCKRLELIA